MEKFLPKAVVLLSGGLDSATTCALAHEKGFGVYALTVEYGQRHHVEIEASKRVAMAMGVVEHRIASVDLRLFGGSALTDAIAVPKSNQPPQRPIDSIPVTYVPARNTIFLALALAYAEVLDCTDLFIGVNAVDYSGYPDCRAEFISAFQAMARLATSSGVRGAAITIHAPLLMMSKEEIIRTGVRLSVDFSLTHSCYDPSHDGRACGDCDSCRIRRDGFVAAGVNDPTEYLPEFHH